MYNRKDKYYFKAKKEGYRARSSFKLKEINTKYALIKRGNSVLDIGCAPGSWLQVVKELTKGKIVGIDIVAMEEMEGVEFIQGSILDEKIISKLGKVDVVLSDIAPKTTGNRESDSFLSYELSRQSFVVALKVLKQGGNFLVKTFQSADTDDLFKEIKEQFEFCKRFVPKTTRQSSKELYIVAKGFKVD